MERELTDFQRLGIGVKSIRVLVSNLAKGVKLIQWRYLCTLVRIFKLRAPFRC